ncbi:ALF repeat-containing protein [Streptomyces ambofaciens]|nr:ALF repeat-containing protein [Streptomyces ambofaciens]
MGARSGHRGRRRCPDAGGEDLPSAAQCFLSLESDSVHRVRTTDYDSPSTAGSTSWPGSAQEKGIVMAQRSRQFSRRQMLAAFVGVAAGCALPNCTVLTRPAYAASAAGTDSVPEGSGLPDTDRGKVVWAYRTGGRAVRTAAAAALVGSAADVRAFLDEKLPAARAEDNRFTLTQSLVTAGRATRDGIGMALSGGTAAVEAFLKGGFQTAVREDLEVAVTTVMAHGGRAVKREATAALESASDFALRAFLSGGQFTAQEEDERVQVTSILVTASPQVREYAERALDDGSPRAMRWFLETGQYIARARDEETATIQQLVKAVEAEGRRAGRKTDEAVELSQQAVKAAEKAKEAALEAKAEAEAAEQDVQRSARAANKAAQAARGAAAAAATAVSASRTAQAAAQRSVAAAQAAAAAAAAAGRAAARAYRAAIGASKDAAMADAARQAAAAATAMVKLVRTVALKADLAAMAADAADAAGAAAAGSAVNAAAAARASADAAVASGAAQSQAAAAQREAAVAEAAAARATQAASRSRTLAGQAATAARAARDAANSAADHAEKAAAAAVEAANHAGKAVDYANRSTTAANAAVEAANKAADAVDKARAVEQTAREAEVARLAEETDEAIARARLEASAEADQLERFNRERTQEARLSEELLALIGSAEAALRDGNTAEAVAAGRRAAVQLIERAGTWTREAAEFALAGSDEDVVHWIDADRVIALQQDNVENVAAAAAISTKDVALAAVDALKTEDAAKIRTFLEGGAIEAAKEDNRVEVTTLLADDTTGPAVRRAAEAALEKGTAEALHVFLHVERATAVREDDRVKATTLLANGGPYVKAAAKIALEGDTHMLRQFIGTTQYEFARIDHDHATHISAIRAAIAGAAKIAQEALEDAARASEAAALARDAADKAIEWADRAKGYAADAKLSAEEARKNAEAAEGSAADAARSAETARQAAAAARKASSVARHAATRAVRSAGIAANYAADAAASATAARKASLAAGEDANAAARAALEAKVLVIQAAIREAIQNALDNATVPIDPDKNGLPEGAESCLTPFGDPIESGNSTNPWELGWSWLTGKGPRSQCFGPGDEFTSLYRDHKFTKEVIAFFASRTQGGDYELGHTYMYDYQLGGFDGAGKYLQDYGTLSTAGLTGNLAYTFLGSHYVRMTPIRKNADGSVVWRYTAFNESDIESATHPPVIGYTDWWSDTVGSFVDKVVGDSGPLSPKTQVIEFDVTLGP